MGTFGDSKVFPPAAGPAGDAIVHPGGGVWSVGRPLEGAPLVMGQWSNRRPGRSPIESIRVRLRYLCMVGDRRCPNKPTGDESP